MVAINELCVFILSIHTHWPRVDTVHMFIIFIYIFIYILLKNVPQYPKGWACGWFTIFLLL